MDHFDGSLRQAGIDLHTHSTASDGRLSPAQLVNKALEAGVKLLALTDHDTTDGLKEAQKTARALGIRLVSGVELSVRWNRQSIHVIGLDFDPKGRCLTSGLQRLRRLREQRALEIAEQLERLGITDAVSWTSEKMKSAQITRAHFARLLVQRGCCRTIRQAFRRYLEPGRFAYRACNWPPLTDGLNWINESGGHTVLAHPLRYGLNTSSLIQLLHEFKTVGGDAIEVCSGSASRKEVGLCAGFARRFTLKGSIGSDYHGDTQSGRPLGTPFPFPASIEPVWEVFN